MSGANTDSKTGSIASVSGLSFSATTRFSANSSCSTSSAGIEVMFPAPSTAPMPFVVFGVRAASPARPRMSDALTPGGIHTSTE